MRILVVHGEPGHQGSTYSEATPSFVDHVCDVKQRIVERYDLTAGAAYLIRPDQHVCARWRQPSVVQVEAAYRRALGHLAH
jgi:3-(3-hydroxy-phenyl)propionate hydroxylase